MFAVVKLQTCFKKLHNPGFQHAPLPAFTAGSFSFMIIYFGAEIEVRLYFARKYDM